MKALPDIIPRSPLTVLPGDPCRVAATQPLERAAFVRRFIAGFAA